MLYDYLSSKLCSDNTLKDSEAFNESNYWLR